MGIIFRLVFINYSIHNLLLEFTTKLSQHFVSNDELNEVIVEQYLSILLKQNKINSAKTIIEAFSETYKKEIGIDLPKRIKQLTEPYYLTE